MSSGDLKWYPGIMKGLHDIKYVSMVDVSTLVSVFCFSDSTVYKIVCHDEKSSFMAVLSLSSEALEWMVEFCGVIFIMNNSFCV
jgi:hypothetical protein